MFLNQIQIQIRNQMQERDTVVNKFQKNGQSMSRQPSRERNERSKSNTQKSVFDSSKGQSRRGTQGTKYPSSRLSEQKVSDDSSSEMSSGETSVRGETARVPLDATASHKTLKSSLKQPPRIKNMGKVTQSNYLDLPPSSQRDGRDDERMIDTRMSGSGNFPANDDGNLEGFKYSMHQALAKRSQNDFNAPAGQPTHEHPSDSNRTGAEDEEVSIQKVVEQYLRDQFETAQTEYKKGEQAKRGANKQNKTELIDISKCTGSTEYFDLVSHQIPISDLYRLEDTRSNSEENKFCAVLLSIVNMELQKKYAGRYLLQVWTRVGKLVYCKILKYEPCTWSLNGRYLIYVQNEKEQPFEPKYRGFQQIYVVRLCSDQKKLCHQALISTTYFKFYIQDHDRANAHKIDLDKYIAFIPYEKGKQELPNSNLFCPDDDYENHCATPSPHASKSVGGHLIVATDRVIKYTEIPDCSFELSKGEIDTRCLQTVENEGDVLVVKFKYHMRLLTLIEIQEGRPCLVTESSLTGQISFLKLWVKDPRHKNSQGNLVFDELNDKNCNIGSKEAGIIPVQKIISVIFKCELTGNFRQCGLALRVNGSLDYFWNFRIVDTMEVADFTDGFVDDIVSDFGHLYFKQVTFEGSKDLIANLQNPNSTKHKEFLAAYYEEQNKQKEQEVEEQKEDGGVLEGEIEGELKQSALSKILDEIKVEVTLQYCCNQWKERIGVNTSQLSCTGVALIHKKYKDIMNQKVANFARIYPWFSNMQQHFVVAHAYFLSLFDITSQQWDHKAFDPDDEIVGGFRIQDKEPEHYWAGVVLRSNTIKFIRAHDGLRGEDNGLHSSSRKEQDKLRYKKDTHAMAHRHELDLKGECIRIATDKQKQRFSLFLVKQKVEKDFDKKAPIKRKNNQEIKDEYIIKADKHVKKHEGCNPVTSLKNSEDESEDEYELKLRLFVNDGTHELYTFDDYVLDGKLHEESEIFVSSVFNPDDAIVVLDNALEDEPQAYIFHFKFIKTKPEVSYKGEDKEENPFARPYNKQLKSEVSNKMVGYIDQICEDGSEAMVFVSRNDVVLAKLSKEFENKDSKVVTNEKEIRYKYFTERHIQAILQLGSWMYTLSNSCSSAQIQNKNRYFQKGVTQKELTRRSTSHYFDNQGCNFDDQFNLDHEMSSDEDQRRLTLGRSKSKLSTKADDGSGSKNFKTPHKSLIFNGIPKLNPGLYAYDLQLLATRGDLVTYRLKDAIVGVNRHIDFCDSSQRISFLKDYDNIDMVPVPHRNTINFLGMDAKKDCIIWRESNGILSVLNTQTVLQSWVIATGKTMKPVITVANMDFNNFDLYESNEMDDSYKNNWQQHPELSIALLKSVKKIDQYDQEVNSILAENQAAQFSDYRSSQMNPHVYMFKVITMSDTIVKEEFSFTFDVRRKSLGEGDFRNMIVQKLIFSRDLTKMMEVYSDSRCSIYTKRTFQHKKRVDWILTHQIKKYPTPLQGLSFANFLFSPNLNFFIDVAVCFKEFVIRSCATNQIVLRIPKGLISFKTTDVASEGMPLLAQRMIFESENQIRIINKFGLDTILQLNMDAEGNVQDPQNPVLIRSIAKIDHFNNKIADNDKKEKHAILDRSPYDPELTLERLVRTNQRVKVKMYHLMDSLVKREKRRKIEDKKETIGNEDGVGLEMKRPSNDGFEDDLDKYEGELEDIYSKVMHQQLQTVDYSQPWKDIAPQGQGQEGQFVAEMSFTILDWQIIEKIVEVSKDNDFDVSFIDIKRLVQLCFNIFPGIKTVLHKFVEKQVDVSQLKILMEKANKYKLPDGERVTIPVLEDIDHNTALDLALTKGNLSMNLASQLLKGIQDYPFLHSGPVLVSGIIRAFEEDVPHLGEFLDKRLIISEHLVTKNLRRVAIIQKQREKCSPVGEDGTNADEVIYGAMIADAWQDKKKLKAALFDEEFKRAVLIQYFDIPMLHEFSPEGYAFFETLQSLKNDQLEMFGRKSVQIIIRQKWKKIKNVIIFMQCVPMIFLLVANLFWTIDVRPYRDEQVVNHYLMVVLILLLVAYFIAIEILQLTQDSEEYLSDFWNLINLFPLVALIQTTFYSCIRGPQHDSNNIGFFAQVYMFIDTFGILMMWLNVFFYLRIWDTPGYLARMIVEVVGDMKIFFVVYCFFHMAFAHAFFFLSWASMKDHRFVFTYWDSFRYSYLTALGEFNYTPQFSGYKETLAGKMIYADCNPLRYIGWALLLSCVILTSIVMLNLLIAIISGTFADVRNQKVLYMYQEKAVAIAQIQKIIPLFIVKDKDISKEEELYGSKKLLLITTERDEVIEDEKTTQIDKTELELCKEKIRDVRENVKMVKDEVNIIRKTKNIKKFGKQKEPTLMMSKTKTVTRQTFKKSNKQASKEDVDFDEEERRKERFEQWKNPGKK